MEESDRRVGRDGEHLMIKSRLIYRFLYSSVLISVLGQGCISVDKSAPAEANKQIVAFLSTYFPTLVESKGFPDVVFFARDEEIRFHEKKFSS